MEQKVVNIEGLLTYPNIIRNLPFCNFRYETRDGDITKVPYDPMTGQRAHIDVPGDFASLADALREISHYDGVGIRVSGNVGCIDLDDCVLPDGSLTENAQKVLEMLPGAWVEYSPSGHGLHLFFIVPEGFVFNVETYYVNNRKVHMENYFPGYTNRFLTVTGNVYREGTLEVSADALLLFQDTFMKRPESSKLNVELPEGGSVLTDAEVLFKAARAENGQKFMDLYLGNWEGHGFPSHSEADLALCSMLAFYCRGDGVQTDRIYRESALMTDKWDERRGKTTYGALTIAKAVNGCKAFYEPDYHPDAAEEFAADDEEIPDEADAETLSRQQTIDALLAEKCGIDMALSPEYLSHAAWAYLNDTARYVKLKNHVPKEVGVRAFEREVQKQVKAEFINNTKTPVQRLALKGVSTPGMLVPENWIVDNTGIRHMEMVFGELKPVLISTEPLFVSSKLVNVDDGTEKLEITFRRNGKYKKLIAPRADMLNRNTIIKYADEGFPVSSGTASTLTRYISEMEAVNSRCIPIQRSIRRAGWVGNEFYPYSLKDGIVAQSDGSETERILDALRKQGNEAVWMAAAAKVRAFPFARAMLAASFASPLLEKLQHRNIYIHFWCDSRGGKTGTLKYSISVWGNPRVLVSKYYSTIVGMERFSGTLKHLPFALDELQTLNQKRMTVNDVVYTMGNGAGKARGRVGSGIQHVEEWNNCIISTGEQPMSSDSSMDGVNTRLMELNAVPVPDEGLAQELHRVSEKNYGFSGEKYICWLVRHLDRLHEDYGRIHSALESGNIQLDNVAVLGLADYYSSIAVFGLPEEQAFSEAVELCRTLLKNLDDNAPKNSTVAAWEFITGWVASNKGRFCGRTAYQEVTPVYGVIEDNKAYVIAREMNKALEEAGFSSRKAVKGFQERGFIETFMDSEGKPRSQTGKRVKGVLTRVYALNLSIDTSSEAAEDFLGEPDKIPPLTADTPDFLR